MKKYVILFLLTIIIFGALNFLTSNDQRPFDGNYFLGFPLTFRTESSEMVYPAPQSAEDLVRTNHLFLVLDVLFAFGLALSGVALFNKIKTKKALNS